MEVSKENISVQELELFDLRRDRSPKMYKFQYEFIVLFNNLRCYMFSDFLDLVFGTSGIIPWMRDSQYKKAMK